MKPLVDILLLAVACYLVFFGYLDDHAFIKTEALRAVVVQEMRERDGFSMPTVHGRPYLNKPPLYAWTTTWISRKLGRFDERVARLPSAVAGTALVLLMYVLGERWIRPRVGLAAATFALLCPTVADYAVRAELDLPFTLFCTCNTALTFAALRARGARRFALWLAAYLFAYLAAMWKGPHSLIFMWLTLAGWGWLRRDWSWLRSAGQWLGLAATLGLLVWWTRALSAFAGASKVGNIAALELLARLVPHRFAHLLEMFAFVPMLVFVTLPVSVFAAMTFSRRVRRALTGDAIIEPPSRALSVRIHACAIGWWRWMRADDRRLLLTAWIVPNVAFMLWAPAKSPRYCLPIFPPIILLGALVAVRLDDDGAHDSRGPRLTTRVWRTFFALLAGGGLIGVIGLVLAIVKVNAFGLVASWRPWAFLAVGGVLPMAVELLHHGGRTLRTRLILSLAALLAWQPVLHDVWWPRRVAAVAQRATAERIDEIVPAGERLYVLGVHEYHDVAVYAKTPFEFADSLDEALARARERNPNADRAYAVFRTDEAEELTAEAQADYTDLFNFDRADENNVCVGIQPAPPG